MVITVDDFCSSHISELTKHIIFKLFYCTESIFIEFFICCQSTTILSVNKRDLFAWWLFFYTSIKIGISAELFFSVFFVTSIFVCSNHLSVRTSRTSSDLDDPVLRFEYSFHPSDSIGFKICALIFVLYGKIL